MKNKRGARCGAFEATKKYLFNISYLTKQMAEGVQALVDYGHVVARLAETLSREEAGMFAQIGWRIIDCAEALQHRRHELFRGMRPGGDARERAN